jgi:hypothetical protein
VANGVANGVAKLTELPQKAKWVNSNFELTH